MADPLNVWVDPGALGRAPRVACKVAFSEPITNFDGGLPDMWRTVRLTMRAVPELKQFITKAPPDLDDVETSEAARLIAFCSIQSLAYESRYGDVQKAKDNARTIIDSMGLECRAWVASTLYTLIDPTTLTLPRGGHSYGSSHRFGTATFEQAILLISRTHAALLIWEDED